MEKKTIGKFISALRRAKGMTQKELGEKLFVSDKTISRWECDESTPELSLIPAIAEIFGITTDELLRGERNGYDEGGRDADSLTAAQKGKGEKQFKVMMHNQNKKFNNLSLISIGLSFVGLICAVIANIGFAKGLIGFCLAALFIVAAEICQICFYSNSKLLIEEDDTKYIEAKKEANTKMAERTVYTTFVNILLLAFCIPILSGGANYGLEFGSWFGLGILSTGITLLISYVLYCLLIEKSLIKKEILFYRNQTNVLIQKRNKILGRLIIIAVCIAVFLIIGIFIINALGPLTFAEKEIFDSYDDFMDFMKDYQGDEYYNGLHYMEFDVDGNLLCEYYANQRFIHKVKFDNNSSDKLPVTVYTQQSYVSAWNDIFNPLQGILFFAIAANFIICAIIYVIKIFKLKSS